MNKINFILSLIYLVIFFPAIFLHELSHYLVSLVLGLKPQFIKFEKGEDGYIKMYIRVKRKKPEWKLFFAFLSPLIVTIIWGCLIIYFWNKNFLIFAYLLISWYFTYPSSEDIVGAVKIWKSKKEIKTGDLK